MHRTIVVGSPREGGRTSSLAEQIFDACIEDCPQDGVSIVALSGMSVSPCMACDACKKLEPKDSPRIPLIEDGDPLSPCAIVAKSHARRHICAIEDDMQDVRKHLDAADELIVVCPLYFASVPAQFKALLDRMQPYFWSDIRAQKTRRSMTLHVIGEGENPYGCEALVTTIKSAFGVAGFKLGRLLNWVGKIDEHGVILEEAEEIVLKGTEK